MSNAKFFGRRSHFYKIFSFFLLLLLLVSVLNYGTMIYLKNKLIEAKMDEQSTYIDNYTFYVNEVFANITKIFSYVENDSIIQNFSSYDYRDHYTYVESVKNLTKKLVLFKTSVSNIMDFYVYLYNNEYMYTPSGQTSPETYFNNRYESGYEQWLGLLHKNHQLSIDKWNYPIKEESSYNISDVNIIKSIRYNNRNIGVMVVNVKSSFLNNLFTNRDFSKDRLIYIINNNNQVISSNTDTSLKTLLKSNDISIVENSNKYIRQKGIISHKTSFIDNMKFVIFTPENVVVESLNNAFYIVNIVFLMLVALLIICTFFMSKKLYYPFKNIVDMLGNSMSGSEMTPKFESEIEYIKGNLTNIISANQQLKSTISDTTPVVLDAVLYKLLVGSFENDQLALLNREYNIKFREGFYNTFVITVELFSEEEEKVFAEYLSDFKKIIYTHAHKWIISTIMTKTNEYTVITYNSGSDSFNDLLTQFNIISNELNTGLPNTKFYIGIGCNVDNIVKLKDCYKEATKAILYRKVNENINIIEYSKTLEEDKPFIPKDFETDLTNIFQQSTLDYAVKYVKDILGINYKNNITIKSYIELCFLINNLITRYATNLDNLKYKELIYIDLDSYLYSVEQLEDILLSNLSIIFEMSATKPTKVATIDRIVQHIDENFNKAINLASVAEHLGYNPNYLSRYFKQTKGMNFTDYLNYKKVEYAKILLTSTKNTVKQIGKSAGFSSSSIFIRTFEQYEGITPGEFRKTSV